MTNKNSPPDASSASQDPAATQLDGTRLSGKDRDSLRQVVQPGGEQRTVPSSFYRFQRIKLEPGVRAKWIASAPPSDAHTDTSSTADESSSDGDGDGTPRIRPYLDANRESRIGPLHIGAASVILGVLMVGAGWCSVRHVEPQVPPAQPTAARSVGSTTLRAAETAHQPARQQERIEPSTPRTTEVPQPSPNSLQPPVRARTRTEDAASAATLTSDAPTRKSRPSTSSPSTPGTTAPIASTLVAPAPVAPTPSSPALEKPAPPAASPSASKPRPARPHDSDPPMWIAPPQD